ncbi:unnamed protein product [Lecanosticta acicola]|uniref:Unnamed protein product n=1 Tax=Lecanosticta acicola TaxID=111012 RepID=A0AAI9E7C5_9PEZI|nr:unnamed protein product [Lecanosticta acicola]
MDSRNPDGLSDWSDMNFLNSHFEDGMQTDSSLGNSAFADFTNLDSYTSDTPMGLMMRTPSKSGPEPSTTAGAQNTPDGQFTTGASAESSTEDSASDSSSRRKRKTNESESPMPDPATEVGRREGQVKKEEITLSMGGMQHVPSFENTFSQPMHNLSLEQSLSHGDSNMSSQYDFNSAASSPIQTHSFNSAMSLDASVMPRNAVAAQFNQDSPVQTINPGMFQISASRDQSPATNNMMFNQASASPHAIFSTPSSDSQETFPANQTWNPALPQNPAWPGDFGSQLASPGAINFTPSPGANGVTPGTTARAPPASGRSPLHIAPISTKSRVETQINVVMTMEKPPPGIEQLHLPLHTIAKSKLLAKEEYEKAKVLELHTMLVCTSAMHNPQMREKAHQRAAAANNEEIQQRAELARETGDEEKNDPKNVEEADKPANGGEVRICNNCIQRERKRAGRKKTKREEEQAHWERFETERVVVFNSNEYLPFKPIEPGQQSQRDGHDNDPYVPPEGAIQVAAAMRIACYCRHQSEKEGFQVIFTLKDHQGNVVAQQMSDSILITDDHKTHPQSFTTPVGGEGFYSNPAFLPNGLPMSHSMVDMTTHAQPFTSSRSAGNLQALAYQAQFNPHHSHVHQLPHSGYASQTTSATMTPTSLSRPGSPSSAGQAGPNKKRKSSSFHRKVPSGLTMTPRVDTSQPPSSNLPSAASISSQFSPGFPGAPMNQSYMTIPNNNGPAQYFGSGPPTPNENGPFNLSQPQVDVSRMNNQAYFSHPSSAVPSRSSSPVLQQTRANMAAYACQQPIQTPTNSMSVRPPVFTGQLPGSAMTDTNHGGYPVITKISPNEGPVCGGTEVCILGENFVVGISVAFGEHSVPTQFVSEHSLLVTSPPGRPGSVHVNLHPPGAPHGPNARYPEPSSKPIFRYVPQKPEDMMVMALKYLSEQHSGSGDNWQNLAQTSATSYIQQHVGQAGLQQQGYPGRYRMAMGSAPVDDPLLKMRRHRQSRALLHAGSQNGVEKARKLPPNTSTTVWSDPPTFQDPSSVQQMSLPSLSDSRRSSVPVPGDASHALARTVELPQPPLDAPQLVHLQSDVLSASSSAMQPSVSSDVSSDRTSREGEVVLQDGAARTAAVGEVTGPKRVGRLKPTNTMSSSPMSSAVASPNKTDTATIASWLLVSSYVQQHSTAMTDRLISQMPLAVLTTTTLTTMHLTQPFACAVTDDYDRTRRSLRFWRSPELAAAAAAAA